MYQVGHQAELFAEVFVLLLHLHSDMFKIALLGLKAIRGFALILGLAGIIRLESADLICEIGQINPLLLFFIAPSRRP